MTTNLVSAVARFLTPDVVSKIAAASGLQDSTAAQQAVNAAVPAILSGLASLAGSPSGARRITNAIDDQSFDPAGVVGQMASSANAAADGTRILSSLFGGNALGALASTLGRFLGVGEGPTRMLMGLLTPVVLSVLGREQRAAGVDENGLANMLAEQKNAIASAMPAGLRSALEDAKPFAGAATVASAQGRPYEARPVDRDIIRPTPGMQHAMEASRPSNRVHWAYWALPLLAFGALFWYLLPTGPEDSPQKSVALPPRIEPAKAVYLATAPASWTSIGSTPNEYVNADIYNRAGEKVGTIRDVLVGPDGKMAAAVINVGRFLGIGDREVAVLFSTLGVEQKDTGRRIIIDVVKDSLLTAPAFNRRVPKQ